MTKEVFIKIRCTPEEKEIWNEMAEKADCSLSQLVKSRLSDNYEVRPAPPAKLESVITESEVVITKPTDRNARVITTHEPVITHPRDVITSKVKPPRENEKPLYAESSRLKGHWKPK